MLRGATNTQAPSDSESVRAMPIIKQVRRTYKYRMYRHDKRYRHLFDQINIAGMIWNHCLALQKRYYRLTGQYISKYDLQKYVGMAKRRQW